MSRPYQDGGVTRGGEVENRGEVEKGTAESPNDGLSSKRRSLLDDGPDMTPVRRLSPEYVTVWI